MRQQRQGPPATHTLVQVPSPQRSAATLPAIPSPFMPIVPRPEAATEVEPSVDVAPPDKDLRDEMHSMKDEYKELQSEMRDARCAIDTLMRDARSTCTMKLS